MEQADHQQGWHLLNRITNALYVALMLQVLELERRWRRADEVNRMVKVLKWSLCAICKLLFTVLHFLGLA